MPITDNDLVAVVHASRATTIKVRVDWTDGVTGEPRGQYQLEWANAADFKDFLEAQTFDEMMRAVLLQCYNRNTGALREVVFDALQGKSFRVMQRVQEV